MIGWLIEGLIASTVLMVAVLALRAPVRKAFGADIAYALWLLPVLRLLLPPLPSAWHAAAVAPVLRASQQVTVLFVDPIGEGSVGPAVQPFGAMLAPVLAILWIAGAVAFFGWHWRRHVRFCRRMLDQGAATDDLDGVQVIETDAATGPLAFGVLRRYVAFPRDFAERYEPEERDLALAHELGHHARGDLIANWVALVVLALHWFNPIAWRAFRAFRADQEIANDARVLAGMNPMRRHTYACAILKAAHPTFLGGAVSATCHLHTINDLKGRLRMLTTTKISPVRLVTGAGALSLLIVAGLGLTASGTAAVAKVRKSVETATGVDIARLDQASVPPPPVAEAAAPTPADVSEPPVPPAPPRATTTTTITDTTTTIAEDGKDHRKVVRVIRRDKDGKVTLENLSGMENMSGIETIPEVRSARCSSEGDPRQMVLHREKDGKKLIVICSNRIEKVAAEGAAIAANSKDIERKAYAGALAGLRAAREKMLRSPEMGAEARAQALAGIDTAIAEIQADIAKVE
ncbi:MAG: M56 family metallopeptidase [Sphingomonas sp.]|mgnify:CR=1 FL=1|uniref:M56 family metallopeptidase n=1 Tax=Sphingomonas sp. TaxID=28214 RepID=UPI0030F68B99